MKDKAKKEKVRSSNLELLRIILMIMVITLHYFNSYMGGLLDNVVPKSMNYYLAYFLESLCIVSVNVFILITGYFSHKKSSVQISKVLKLFSLGIFYSILLCLVSVFILHNDTISLHTIRKLFDSIFGSWFLTIYCFLYLLIPFINKVINNIGEKQLLSLIIVNVLFLNIYFTFFNTLTLVDGGYGIANFINLYLIGAYISKYKNKDIPKKYTISMYLIITMITTIFTFYSGLSWSYASIFNIIGSVCLFLIFKSIKMKNSKFINNISGYVFPIYCIHTCPIIAQSLFRGLFHTYNYWNNKYMIIHLGFTVISIFIICVVLEYIRRLLFKKIIDDNIDKIKYEIDC